MIAILYYIQTLYISFVCFVNRSVMIHNRSDVIVHYEWKAFATEEEEQMEKEMYY